MEEEVAIIGVGLHPNGVFPEKNCLELALYAIKQAIEDAGINKDEIDAILTQDTFSDRWYNSDVAWSKLVETLGLGGKCKINFRINSGGSTSSTAIHTAAGLIATGKAETILVSHADKLGSGLESVQDVIDAFSSFGMSQEFEANYGYNQQAVSALVANRYIYDTGTPVEAYAAVALSMRKWAVLNPNALIKRVPTLEEILTSPMVVSPFTRRMCNVTCDGAEAFIITSAKNAEKISKKPVYVLGMSSLVTHYTLMNHPAIQGVGDAWDPWAKVAEEAYEKSGVKPEDIDVAELYDAYPILPLLTLEALGFVDKGKAGKFVIDENTMPGGSLPMTTNGGMIAGGHTGTGGGLGVLIESVIQLKGQAGERQVKDAKFSVVTESGGQGMDAHVMVLGGERP
ncbi:MAG: thiolase family protein [Candidatus Lokiarchaeia archaeon]